MRRLAELRWSRQWNRRRGRFVVTAALFCVVVATVTACAGPVTTTTTVAATPASSAPLSVTAPVREPSTTAQPSSVGAAASGTAVATTAEPSNLQSAQCYFSPDVAKPDNSVGLAFGFKEGGGYDNTVSVENYLDACHQSLVSKRTIDDADPVTACVLADGRVGVFPGPEDICAAVGLPSALRSASDPISTE